MASRKISVEIVGDADSFKRALGTAADHTDRFGSALGGLAKAGVFAAGAAGIGGLFVTLKAGIGEYAQATKVAAQTNAVITSTGGAANVTAKHVDNLATSIMKYSGIDDEAIKSGENMLLTFKNIRNEAGKGNDIFDQSTKILTDMSVALGGDASKNAIRLGKALNDPVKGVTALTKVGVTFTQAQKDTIKSLVDSGNSMGAQKIILRELNSEFGGSAKAVGDTLPGQINKLKETFNNLAGDLVAKAVPALTAFSGFVSSDVMPRVSELFSQIGEKAGPIIQNLADAFTSAVPAIMAFIQPLGDFVRDNLVPIFQNLSAVVSTAIQNIAAVIAANRPQIEAIFKNLGDIIQNLWTVAEPILRLLFTVVLPNAIKIAIPIVELIIAVIKRITDAVVYVSENIGAPIEAIKTAFVNVKNWISDRVGDIVGFFTNLPGRIANAITSGAGELKAAVTGLFGKVIDWVKGVFGINSPSTVFAEIGRNMIQGFIHGVGGMAGVLKDYVVGLAKSLIPSFSAPTGSGLVSGTGGLVGRVLNALNYAKQMGWHGSVISGFRTYAEQAALYKRYLAGGPIAAPPGHSSHERGEAVDVSDAARFDSIMAGAPPGAQLFNNVPGDFNHFSVSGHAEGGIINKPLHMFGEAGPEAVIPLAKWMDGWQQVKQAVDDGWTQISATNETKNTQDAWWQQLTLQQWKDFYAQLGQVGYTVETTSQEGLVANQQDTQTLSGNIDDSLSTQTAFVTDLLGKISDSVKPLHDDLVEVVAAIRGSRSGGGGTSSGGSSGGGKSSGSDGGWVQVPNDPNDGWVQVPAGGGGWVEVPQPTGHGRLDAQIFDASSMDITVNLDGSVIYQNQKRYAARDVLRNGGTGIAA